MSLSSNLGLLGVFTAGMLAASTASAVTIGFEAGTDSNSTYTESGFTLTSNFGNVDIVNGNCGNEVENDECAKVASGGMQQDETLTLTFAGGAFDLASFLFNLDGGAELTVSAVTAANQVFSTQGSCVAGTSGGQCFTLANVNLFGVTSVSFTNTGTATLRLDNFIATAAVPLPATGLLLLAGLGGLAAFRRRKQV